VSDNPLFEKYGQTVKNGTVIFQEDELGEKMYIIQSGVVQITKKIDGRDHLLAELGKGEVFRRDGYRLQHQALCLGDRVGYGEILAFDRQGFEAMIGKNTKIAMSIIDKLSKRLQNANAQIQQLHRRNERSMVALNLYNRFLEDGGDERTLKFAKTVDAIALDLQSPEESCFRNHLPV
jgi:CRP/FNR family cyclic AMP-dependent transcriptional regulator